MKQKSCSAALPNKRKSAQTAKARKLFLFPLLLLLISSSDYHGYLHDVNGEYLTGDFIFDKTKAVDLKEFESNQLRKDKFTDEMLIRKININLKVEYENIIHIKITDPNNPDRWEVPTDLVDRQYSFNLHKNMKSSTSPESFYSLYNKGKYSIKKSNSKYDFKNSTGR